MINCIRDRYKVERKDYEKAYEYQLALKYNEEYEKRVENTFIKIVEIFKNKYKNVYIEPPRGREKSDKSLQEKVKKLEIERISKKYAVGRITKQEIDVLYELIVGKIKNRRIENEEEIIGKIDEIFFDSIQNLDTIDMLMQTNEISDNTKTALLRISKSKLIKQNDEKSEKIQEEIENKYGNKETNLLHWESIEKLTQEEQELQKLDKPMEYLRIKDLRAFKIVIASVPDDIKTENEKLIELLKRRKNTENSSEISRYNDLCCIELEKEFANYLATDTEVLEELNIRVLPDGYKRKVKDNGYIADHIKFCYNDHPEYIFELQLRSLYRENISRANGSAAHDKRDGKTRVFPSTENKDIFFKQAKYIVPKYKIIKREENKFFIHKCSLLENMMEYYLGYIDIDSEEFDKAIEYINEDENIRQNKPAIN